MIFGSPHRHEPKTLGIIPLFLTVDLLGFFLQYLKSWGLQPELFSFFGLVQSSLSVWVDLAEEGMFRVVKRRDIHF